MLFEQIHRHKDGTLIPVEISTRLVEHEGRQVIASLVRWGDRWLADESGPPVTLVHQGCGHTTTPTLTCSECGEALEPRAMRPVAGPATRLPESNASWRRET